MTANQLHIVTAPSAPEPDHSSPDGHFALWESVPSGPCSDCGGAATPIRFGSLRSMSPDHPHHKHLGEMRYWADRVAGSAEMWWLPSTCARCLQAAQRQGEKAAKLDDRHRRQKDAGLNDREIALNHGWLDSRIQDRPDLPWRYIHGPSGTGKTTQLALAVRYHVARGKACRFISALDLVESLKPKHPTNMTVEDYVALDVLAIDELGLTQTTWAATELWRVIDGRYRARKTTLFSSNYRLRSIAEHKLLGLRVMERIAELCGEWSHNGYGIMHLTHNHRSGLETPDPEFT